MKKIKSNGNCGTSYGCYSILRLDEERGRYAVAGKVSIVCWRHPLSISRKDILITRGKLVLAALKFGGLLNIQDKET